MPRLRNTGKRLIKVRSERIINKDIKCPCCGNKIRKSSYKYSKVKKALDKLKLNNGKE